MVIDCSPGDQSGKPVFGPTIQIQCLKFDPVRRRVMSDTSPIAVQERSVFGQRCFASISS